MVGSTAIGGCARVIADTDRVDAARRRALDAEAVDVGPVERMLERATKGQAAGAQLRLPDNVVPARFARDPDELAVARPEREGGTGEEPSTGGRTADQPLAAPASAPRNA